MKSYIIANDFSHVVELEVSFYLLFCCCIFHIFLQRARVKGVGGSLKE